MRIWGESAAAPRSDGDPQAENRKAAVRTTAAFENAEKNVLSVCT
jgi:hypothetical protein